MISCNLPDCICRHVLAGAALRSNRCLGSRENGSASWLGVRVDGVLLPSGEGKMEASAVVLGSVGKWQLMTARAQAGLGDDVGATF